MHVERARSTTWDLHVRVIHVASARALDVLGAGVLVVVALVARALGFDLLLFVLPVLLLVFLCLLVGPLLLVLGGMDACKRPQTKTISGKDCIHGREWVIPSHNNNNGISDGWICECATVYILY